MIEYWVRLMYKNNKTALKKYSSWYSYVTHISSPCPLFQSREWYWDGRVRPPLTHTDTRQITLKAISTMTLFVILNVFSALIGSPWGRLAPGSLSWRSAAAEGCCALVVPAPRRWHLSAACSECKWHPEVKEKCLRMESIICRKEFLNERMRISLT